MYVSADTAFQSERQEGEEGKKERLCYQFGALLVSL